MTSREHLTPGCDKLSIAAPEIQFNPILSEITLKQEIVECNDEESTCSQDMYTSDPLELSENLNIYDSKDHVMKQVKNELPEDEFLQTDYSIHSKNKELLKQIDKQEVKHEKIDEGSLLNIKEEDDDIEYQFTLETERIENHEILDTSIHRELKITPQVQDAEHSHKLDNSPKGVTGSSFKCNKYNADVKHEFKLNERVKSSHSGEEIEEIVYKCDSCEHVYKSKQALALHVKRIHYDYGRMFSCWCGKEFRSPLHLATHRRVKHDLKAVYKKTVYKCQQCNASFKFSHSLTRHVKTIHCTTSIEFQCDYCKRFFKAKQSLLNHITSLHYDYNKVFECWCGKQYHSPGQLDVHKKRKHIYVHDGFKFIFS